MDAQQIQRDASRRRTKVGKEPELEENFIEEINKLMDALFELRLIERISRPMDRSIKVRLVEEYAHKLKDLHIKLAKLRTDFIDKSYSENNMRGAKSVMGSLTNRPQDWKKSIRAIESRYLEIFVEGSFKHYSQLLALNNFADKMQLINIEEWANACLETSNETECC